MVQINPAEDDFPPSGGSVVLEQEYDAETPASIAVVQAICTLEHLEPTTAVTELGFTLYEHIDPEALDMILTDGTGSGETVITFKVETTDEYIVEITDTGTITIRRAS